MLGGNIFPHSIRNSGIESLLSSDSILSFFKKFCNAVKSRIWRVKKGRNSRYEDIDFLRVFFISEIIGRSIHDTSEMLNIHYLSHKKGRRKIFADGRRKRLVPHQTEVNRYLRMINLKKAREILQECLDGQLIEALELGLISRKINLLIDFTEHPYYGKREDEMIKGTNRQKGTNKMRHYLGFSILSRNLHLYAGLEQVASGQSKIPIIIKYLDHLLEIGFELGFVLMDREFYRVEIINAVKERGGNVLIPAKKYKKVKQIIADYIENKNGRVRKYTFSTNNNAKRRFRQDVYLIIKAKNQYTLRGIKRDYQAGRITLKDAQNRTFIIMTSEKPKGKESSWASRTALFYRRRWLIETGFSDLNRINRRWKSNHDNVRYLDMLARFLLYNSWKMNRKLIQKSRKNGIKRMGWTLIQNQDYLKMLLLLSEKKSRGVIG